MKNLNFKNNLGLFRILLFSFILLNASFNAQESESQIKIEPTTVVLKDGAKIFSTDEAFNQQINSNVVVLKNADRTPESKNSAKVLEATSSKPDLIKKDFKQEVKNSAEKKQKEDLKKIEKEINHHQERKKAYQLDSYEAFPSSEDFFAITHTNTDYIASVYDNCDLSKCLITKDFDASNCFLSYLHSKKYLRYKSKSLDFSFAKVFSVRPPPSFS